MSRGTKDLIRNTSAAPLAGLQRQPTATDLQPQPPPPPGGATSRPPPGAAASSAAPNSNADLVAQLKAKLDTQRRELDDRTDNVNAIQRNFQRLSEMYAGDRNRIAELEAELSRLMLELESLRAEKKLFVALKSEFAALQALAASDRQESQAAVSQLRDALANEKRVAQDATAQLALLRSTVENAGRMQDEITEQRAQMNDIVSDLEHSIQTLFTEIISIQREAGVVKSAVGAGISTFMSAAAATIDVDTRLRVVIKAVSHCAASAFAPVHRAIDELLHRHEGTLEERDEAHAAAKAQLAAARDAAVKQSDELRALLKDATDKLKEAQKLWNLERQTIQDKASHMRNDCDAKIASHEAKIQQLTSDLNAANERLRRAAEELAAAHDANSTLAGEVKNLRDAHDAAVAAGSEGATLLARTASELEEALARERALSASLRSSVESMRVSVEDMRKKLNDEVLSGKAQKASFDADAEKWSVERRHYTELIATLEMRLARCEADLGNSEAALRAARESLMQAEASTATASRNKLLEREVDRLTHEVNVVRGELAAVKMSLETAEADRAQLSLDLDEARRIAARCNAGVSDQSAKLAEEESLRKKVEAQLEALKLTVKALTEEARTAKESEQRAVALHLAATAEVAATRRELDSQKAAVAIANDARNAADARSDAIQRRLAVAEAESADARRQMEQIIRSDDDAKQRSRQVAEQYMQLQVWAEEIKALQRESIKTVKKVLAAEEACESGYSCQSCLEVMKNPVVCAPCGHAYCRSCFTAANKTTAGGGKGTSYCPECDDSLVTHVMPSKNLDLLTGKFDFRKRALRELAALLEKTFSGLERSSSALEQQQ